MSKSAFAQTIIAKLKGSIGTDGLSYGNGSAATAMSAVAAGITEYIIANTTVTVFYSGIISIYPFPTDPVKSDTFKVVGSCAPNPSNGFDSWIKQIEANIIAGFQLAPTGSAGVSFSIKPFMNTGITTVQGNLKATHDVGDKDPQQKVWEVVCGGIMDWINGAAKNPLSGAASRASGPSTGMASIIKITIT